MELTDIQTAINYKKNIAGRFVAVDGAKIKQAIAGQQICVTRKIDGHLQVVFFRDGKCTMLNAQGKQRADGLKCLDVFAESLKSSGVKSASIAAELYYPAESGRPRCSDVISALADNAKRDLLRLAPFDIIELDGTDWNPGSYAETHKKLCSFFKDDSVSPIEMRIASSTDEVQEIYDEWVVGEGAEGLVIHSESHTYGGYGAQAGYRPKSDKLYKLVLHSGREKQIETVGFYV